MSTNKTPDKRPLMSPVKIIVSFLLFAILFEFIAMPFFVRRRTSIEFLTASLFALLMLLPEYLLLEGADPPRWIVYISLVGVSLFPASYARMTSNYIRTRTKPHPVVLAAGPPVVMALAVFFNAHATLIVSVMLIAFYAWAARRFYKSVFTSTGIYLVLQAALLAAVVASALSAWSGVPVYYAAGAGALHAITSLLFLYGYHARINRIAVHFRESRELNRRLIHTNARLRQKVEQLKALVQERDSELLQISRHASLAEVTTGIAHELAQPLTGIKAIAQNMMDDINYDEFDNLEAAAELMKICTLVDKSASIIDHIRNFSRRSGMNMRLIDLNRVVLDAIDLVNLQFKKHSVDIILVLNENISRMHGDRISIEQLIINLLLNARDAIMERQKTAEDGYTGRITIATEQADDRVRLLIEDNGTGIPEDVVKKIWSPFFTTKRRASGTGIGLSISSRILREHNADISVESAPGRGACFIMTFPAPRERVGTVSSQQEA